VLWTEKIMGDSIMSFPSCLMFTNVAHIVKNLICL
jgi:hypothetical protein